MFVVCLCLPYIQFAIHIVISHSNVVLTGPQRRTDTSGYVHLCYRSLDAYYIVSHASDCRWFTASLYDTQVQMAEGTVRDDEPEIGGIMLDDAKYFGGC